MGADSLTKELDSLGIEVVIGLETHIRLNTLTKLFCSCPNREDDRPNVNICSICTGQMGVLPALNKEAIRKAVYFGKAINSPMSNRYTFWDRKHYEYPDLPKNFQLTQFHKPIIPGGYVDCYRNDGTTFRVEIEQVHIEEDAAKLVHEGDISLVDFNKSSVPLIEVVTKPCISSIFDASVYAQYLQRIVQNLGISEANLEKGEFKSDVSVSLRKRGSSELNARAEIKNLNSFRFMTDAVVEEVKKQLLYYKQNASFRDEPTTVLFDADLKQTRTMRKKEYAADYRYIVEPDLPVVNISDLIDTIVVDPRLLPFNIEKRLITGGVRPQDAKFFTSDPVRSRVFLELDGELDDPLFIAKTVANNLKPEDYVKIENITPFAGLFRLFKSGEISVVLFQKAIEQLIADNGFDYIEFLDKNSVSESELDKILAGIIESFPAEVKKIEAGNLNIAGILVGKVLKTTGKGVSGKIVRERLLNLIAGEVPEAGKSEKSVKEKAGKEADGEHFFDYSESPGEFVIRESYRTHLINELTESAIGSPVTIAGWVVSVRDHGELLFIDLRDSSYEVMQLRFNRASVANFDAVAKVNPESVVSVEGTVIMRSDDDFNRSIRTGKIELDVNNFEVINHCKTLPFEIKKAHRISESKRLKYKFLDHRNDSVRTTLIKRHRIIKLIRDLLDDKNFLEIETPVLSAGTDEGAREFIVPSRNFPGKFYTLPQAPQQFKQMLMLGGFANYFQIARCFRDEDTRGDRQAEFTQLDIEQSFVSMNNIIELNTNLFNTIVEKVYGKKWKLFSFKTIKYSEAIEKYGTDRPDLRFGLEMKDITEIVKQTTFKVFSDPIKAGGIVKCIKVPGESGKDRMSKGQIEKLTALAQANGLGGLAYIVVNTDGLQSPIIKYLGEEVANNIISGVSAKPGDIVFFSAADPKIANKALDAVRQELGRLLHLIKPGELHPAWIIDFPLFEQTDNGRWKFSHNPFSMPAVDSLQDHLDGKNIGEIIAQQYDLVLNGFEIGGGSIRAHKPEILAATYRNMGYNFEEMRKSIGHMYDAFQYGAPPHGGIAWGLDRLVMILENKSSIREVMAYPKTGSGEDLLFNSPSELSDEKLAEANIKRAIRRRS